MMSNGIIQVVLRLCALARHYDLQLKGNCNGNHLEACILNEAMIGMRDFRFVELLFSQKKYRVHCKNADGKQKKTR